MNEKKEYVPGNLDLSVVWGEAETDQKLQRPQITIIGAGCMGAEHIDTIASVGEADVVGIYDPNPGSLKYCLERHPKLLGKAKIHSTLEQACSDSKSDSVIISTPNYTHLDVTKMACKHHKHILLEKPIAATVADARQLADIAKTYDKVFYVGLEYRLKPVCQELFQELNVRKTAGAVKMIYIMEHRRWFLNKWNEWNKFSEYSGGTMIEKCCHYFDLFNLIAGAPPVKVYASGGRDVNFLNFQHNEKKSDIIDNSFSIIDYENGVRACLNLCMFMGGCREEIIVNGDKASLYAYDVPREEIEIRMRGKDTSRIIKVEPPSAIQKTGAHGGSTYYEHLAFYEAIRNGTPPPVSAEEGFMAVAVGVAVELSVRTGQPVFMKDILS